MAPSTSPFATSCLQAGSIAWETSVQFALSYLYALQVVTVPFWELVYEPPARVWFSPWRLAIGLAITGWALWWIRRSWPQVRAVTWFWLGWFLLTLLPTANLLDQEAPFAERYVFLSALSPIFLLAWILSNRENGGRQKRWTGLAVAVLLLLATQTVARGAFFRDYEVFWPAVGEDRPQVAQRPQQPGGGVDHGRPAERGGRPL